jgi:hypothetical protein
MTSVAVCRHLANSNSSSHALQPTHLLTGHNMTLEQQTWAKECAVLVCALRCAATAAADVERAMWQ